MARRIRMTQRRRRASAAPALPEDQLSRRHPAAYPDPEADAYENGDTSSWAADPHPAPYDTVTHPNVPHGGQSPHPAADEIEDAVMRKAARCVHVASLMYPGASDREIQNRALRMMEWPTRRLRAAAKRAKKASRRHAADEDIERMLMAELDSEGTGDAYGMSEEAMLAEMLAEEDDMAMGMEHDSMDSMGLNLDDEWDESDWEDDEEDMMLAEMLEGGRTASDDEWFDDRYASDDDWGDGDIVAFEDDDLFASDDDDDDWDDDDDDMEKEASFVDNDLEFYGDHDPMSVVASDEVEDELAALYSRTAADEIEDDIFAGGDEDWDDDEDMEKEASYHQRPRRAKKASGARTLGGVSRTASSNEIDELNSLWDTAPDITGVF